MTKKSSEIPIPFSSDFGVLWILVVGYSDIHCTNLFVYEIHPWPWQWNLRDGCRLVKKAILCHLGNPMDPQLKRTVSPMCVKKGGIAGWGQIYVTSFINVPYLLPKFIVIEGRTRPSISTRRLARWMPHDVSNDNASGVSENIIFAFTVKIWNSN